MKKKTKFIIILSTVIVLLACGNVVYALIHDGEERTATERMTEQTELEDYDSYVVYIKNGESFIAEESKGTLIVELAELNDNHTFVSEVKFDNLEKGKKYTYKISDAD